MFWARSRKHGSTRSGLALENKQDGRRTLIRAFTTVPVAARILTDPSVVRHHQAEARALARAMTSNLRHVAPASLIYPASDLIHTGASALWKMPIPFTEPF